MEMIEIADFLKSIPNVIWSGLIASIITLSGVFLSNISNNRRLTLQLQHDANERAKERTAILRREVYLLTSEELVKANSHLCSLPQLDVTKVNLADGLQGFFTAAAKLQLVAEPKTSLLVNQLSASYGELVFNLMAALPPLTTAKNDIKINDDFYNRSQAEINRILMEQRKINESDKPNLTVFEALGRSLEFEQEQSAKFNNSRSEAWQQFNHYNLIFQKNLLTQFKAISSKQIPVLIEIRRDLGLTNDLPIMEEQMKQQWVRMEACFDNLIASLKEKD